MEDRSNSNAENITDKAELSNDGNDSVSLISCVRNIRRMSVTYRIFKIIKNLAFAFFWCFSISTFFLLGCSVINDVFVNDSYDNILLYIKVILSILGICLCIGILYYLFFHIPFKLISVVIVGICARKCSFDRYATLTEFKRSSFLFSGDVYNEAYIIYPLLVCESHGRLTGILIFIADFCIGVISSFLLFNACVICRVIFTITPLFFELFPYNFPYDDLIALCVAVMSFIGFLVLIFSLKAIYDILIEFVTRICIKKWQEALND